MNAAEKIFYEMQDCLIKQKNAFIKEGPPSLNQRKKSLKTLRQGILDNREEIEQALISDFGNRSRHETRLLEIMTLLKGIDYLCSNLKNFMRPQKRHVPFHFHPARAYVSYQPLGVIGIVSPWNYPISLTIMPLATAIASGNRAMIKPSELTPTTSNLILKILSNLFPREEVAVFNGDAQISEKFISLVFDHLFFTGSTRIGKIVMKVASENLVPVTLELGGKSPVVVSSKTTMDYVAKEIVLGKLFNCGQTCVAPDYIMLHENQINSFVAAFDKYTKEFYPDGPISEDYTSIINRHHHNRLKKLVEDAAHKGATIVEVGNNPKKKSQHQNSMAPKLILNPKDEMDVMSEEIFGPLLPVMTYQNIDNAIEYVNSKPRPLALYYFGDDTEERKKILSRTTSGNVCINTTMKHYALDDLPFGGVGASGIGSYHGIEGFQSMSHAKGILEFRKWNMSNLIQPPFGKLADFFLNSNIR